MREDLHIAMSNEFGGSTCGCQIGMAVCEEGKRLEARVAAAYRNCAGLYGRRARCQATAIWDQARRDLEQHYQSNHRD